MRIRYFTWNRVSACSSQELFGQQHLALDDSPSTITGTRTLHEFVAEEIAVRQIVEPILAEPTESESTTGTEARLLSPRTPAYVPPAAVVEHAEAGVVWIDVAQLRIQPRQSNPPDTRCRTTHAMRLDLGIAQQSLSHNVCAKAVRHDGQLLRGGQFNCRTSSGDAFDYAVADPRHGQQEAEHIEELVTTGTVFTDKSSCAAAAHALISLAVRMPCT